MNNQLRNTIFGKFCDCIDDIVAFLKEKNYFDTTTNTVIQRIRNKRKEELSDDNSTINLSIQKNKELIDYLLNERETINQNGDSYLVTKKILAKHYFLHKKIPFNGLLELLQVPSVKKATIHFDEISKERVRNTLAFFSGSMSDKYLEYFNKMLDFVLKDSEDTAEYRELIDTDAIPQVLYHWILDTFHPEWDNKPKSNDSSDFIRFIKEHLDQNTNPIADFLRNNKILRNYSGVHFDYVEIKRSERCKIIQEALFTYVGIAYAFLDKFGFIDKDPFKGKCVLTIHYDQQSVQEVRPEIYEYAEEDDKWVPITPKNDLPSKRQYSLDRNRQYFIDCQNGTDKVEIPISCLFGPAPLCIIDKQVTHFYRSVNEVPQKYKDQYFLQGVAEEIKENVEPIPEILSNTDKLVHGQQEQIDETKKLGKGQHLQTIILSCGVAAIIAIAILFLQKDKKTYQTPELTPADYVVKGDMEFAKMMKGEELEQFPMTFYRKAIELYEEILKKDSTNEDAHISLSKMYMRGKGYYDIDKALAHAKSISHTPEGEGLYTYLLVLTGHEDEARIMMNKSLYKDTNYMKLAKTIFAIDNNQNNITIIQDALYDLYNFGYYFLEARQIFDYYIICGIQNPENENEYLQKPLPVESIYDMEDIAIDSVVPTLLLELAEIHSRYDNIEGSINYASAALLCGINQADPLIKQFIIQNFSLDNEFMQNILHNYSKHVGHIENFGTLSTDYQSLIYNIKKSKQNYNDAIILADSLINEFKRGNTQDYELRNIEGLYRSRITLYMLSGDSTKAVSQALADGMTDDSLAMMLYLRGVKAVLNNPSDTIYSDSLINLAAERGLAEAIYTRLRRTPPIYYWERIEPAGKKWANDSLTLYEYFTIKLFQRIPQNAFIADSIWKNNPFIANALAFYWQNDYGKQEQYIEYCSSEYRDYWNFMNRLFYPPYVVHFEGEEIRMMYVDPKRYKIDSYGNKKYDNIDFVEANIKLPFTKERKLTHEDIIYLLDYADVCMADALLNHNGKMFRLFCGITIGLAQKYADEDEAAKILMKYQPFLLEKYSLENDSICIPLITQQDLPIYIY